MKRLVLAVVLLALCGTAQAEVKFRASAAPQLDVFTKYSDVAGVDIRNVNPGFNLDASIELYKGFGLGADLSYMAGSFDIPAWNVSGDIDVWGFGGGPRYYYSLSDKLEVYGLGNVGFYKTKLSASAFGVTLSESETAFGFDVGAGLNYQIWKMMTLGAKAQMHYLSNTGNSDDAIIYSVGPTIGVKF